MKLGIEKIRDISRGAASVFEKNGEICFQRFTDAQMEIYANFARSSDFVRKTYATSGVRLEFMTDGDILAFGAHVVGGSSRKFFNFDLYINDVLCEHIGGDYSGEGEYEYSLCLGEGKKKVVLYFPWSAQANIKNLSVENATFVDALPKKPKMLCYGDSITHGYDAFYPSLSYASQLADKLGAEAYNRGIGGEKFFPKLLETEAEEGIEYISVAYGTNDWSGSARDVFERDCKDFYDKLASLYPNSKIFAITPIWRADNDRNVKCGAFEGITEYIKNVTACHKNIYVIDGIDLTPHFSEFYSDKYLHPNDLGFFVYADRLYNEIKKFI